VIHVVSAIIFKPDSNDRLVFLQQRKKHRQFPLYWETPGGKVEAGESQTDALRRELNEELGLPRSCCTIVHTGRRDSFSFARERFNTPDDWTMTFYRVEVPPDWEPQCRDAIGMGWFTAEAILALKLAPGTEWLLLPHRREAE
jgi:8-oxo-dGTP pyrophosphatase MutT (NUDIX family)